jgi:L-arabonate dehydrase
MKGGYQAMYIRHVTQADEGADLDFLVGCRGSAVPRESH